MRELAENYGWTATDDDEESSPFNESILPDNMSESGTERMVELMKKSSEVMLKSPSGRLYLEYLTEKTKEFFSRWAEVHGEDKSSEELRAASEFLNCAHTYWLSLEDEEENWSRTLLLFLR